jgi:selenide,water dikinase
LIQTLDFFTPMVDDPYAFGQIAAANALNDVYAMGGRPLLAMNIVCFPECGEMELLKEILAGGLAKIQEAGALLVGGHSVDDNEPKYGLAVTGLVEPARLITNGGARDKDVLFLTKPLGGGVITTAMKAEMASKVAEREAVMWMSRLNRDACEAMQEVGAHAATDITGFGLAGHLLEMAESSQVQIEIFAGELRFMREALDYAGMGLIPGGAYRNRDYMQDRVAFTGKIDQAVRDLVFSPETSGGLIIAVAEDKAEALKLALERRNCPVNVIGRVIGHEFKTLRISGKA